MNQTGPSLKRYAITRLALVVPMVFILLTLVFLLMRVAPGNPVSAALGGHAPPAVIKAISHQLGYDKPVYVQYAHYLGQIIRGNFGTTISDRRSVGSIILVNGAATLELTFFALIVAIVVGVLVGLVSGRFRDSPIDAGGRLFGIVVYATPVFFLGMLAQLVFGIWLNWLPTSDQASPITEALLQTHTNIFFIDAIIDGNWTALKDIVEHLILPATTLGIVYGGVFIRLIRINVIRTLKEDYIEAARARGINERSVVYRHAFRNALVPVITVVGLSIALLLGGAILTETTFSMQGLGAFTVQAITNQDFPEVMGVVMLAAFFIVIANMLVDILYAVIDPRVRTA